MSISLIAATGSPLDSQEGLHVEALEAHLSDQWQGGMTGVLIGGTMGAMQLLAEQTFRDLASHGVRHSAGKGEVLIGVGDAGFARTRDRVQFVNNLKPDGVVVLSPYLFRFNPAEVTDYFTALADISKRPLYLYDLPGLTGVKLDTETVLKLAKHPNIKGIKSSGDFAWTRQLMELAPSNFRVIVAQADLIDVLLRHGVSEHLDGVFSLAPGWVKRIVTAAGADNWGQASAAQAKMSDLLRVLKQYGVFPTFTVLLNARGIPGNYAPAPFRPLTEQATAAVLAEPIVRELLRDTASAGLRRPVYVSADGNGNGNKAEARVEAASEPVGQRSA